LKKNCDKLEKPYEIIDELTLSLKRIVPVKEANLFLFDSSFNKLNPIGTTKEYEITSVINHYYKEGVLNLLFESAKVLVVPELQSHNNNEAKLNYIIVPIFEKEKKKGLFVILTSLRKESITEIDKQMLSVILNLGYSKIERLQLKKDLTTVYEELQTYQAKLANDFRLSAIGELTEGIVEDIMSPLQVIVSQIDMLDIPEESNEEVESIKNQIQKINRSVTRLIKFANVTQSSIKIHPCSINSVINDYFTLLKSTLDSSNIEFVLDLDSNLPSILSHENYFFQILTNLFGIIKARISNGGGIIIQSRKKSDSVLLKVITTANLKDLSRSKIKSGLDINYKIIKNLMKKHEGDFIIESFDESGSAIMLSFPLRRKIRK
jgi:K+-sensing histidine kinase KdpD